MVKAKPRLTKTARFFKRVEAQTAPADSGLDKILRDTYIPFLFGEPESLPPTAKALAYTIPTHKLAERAVAQLFEMDLPPDNTHGYDLDTTGLKWDGVDYGKIEIRSRSLSYYVQPTPKGDFRDVYRFPFCTQAEMVRKRENGSADWFFCCGHDYISKELVWFRFPSRLVFSKSALNVYRGVDGGYGWADSYLWVGPENEL